LIANYPIKIPRLNKSDVILKFLGTRGYVDESSVKHHKRASLLIDDGKTKLLIDWGDVNGELPDCDAIIITHAHPDHLFGLKNKEVKVPVFITDATTHSEYYEEEDYKFNKTEFKRRSAFRVGDIEIISVPVLHSTKAPNIALFISVNGYRICYASDVLSIREEHREKFLTNCDLYIGDGSTLREDGLVRWDEKRDEAIGHAGIPRQIKWCEEAGVKRIIFTHFGSEPIKLGKELEKKLAELGAEMAYDGWTTSVELHKAINLEEIDDKYAEKLSDKKLVELYRELHEIYEREGRITEPLLNAEIFVENEMKKRGIERDINDELSQEARFWIQEYPPWEKADKKITLQEVIDAFPDIIKLPADVPAIYLVGGIANRGWVTHHDIDVRIASDEYLPEVKRALIHACTRNDIREKLEFIFDTRGGIGVSIPLYIPKEGKLEKDKELRLGKPSQPQKPATGWQKNEFWKVENAWTKWAASRIDRGIMVQPKYDGMSFQIHVKDGKPIGFFTEDQLRNRIEAFKESSAELPKLLKAKDAVLVAEMVEYSDKIEYPENDKLWTKYRQIPREDLVKWIAAKPSSLDDSRVIFHVHDLLYLNGENYTQKPAIERYEKLKEILKEGKHFHVVESKTANDMREFFKYAKWARYFPNSEGAVFKVTDSVYKIRYDTASRNRDWAKLKNLKELDVMVLRPHLVRGTKDVFTWQGVVGPIPEKDLNKYRERDIMEFKGKKYLRIGTCYNVKGKKPEGSILTVMPIRIERSEEDGKVFYTWMFPKAGLWRPEKREPDPIDVVEKLSKLGTRPYERTEKADEKVIEIKLPLCPEKYAFNKDICPLIDRIKILVDGVWKSKDVKLRVQELKYPVDCKLANYYRCRRVKPYYYRWREE